MTVVARIDALALYPVKSCGAVPLTRAVIGPRGLESGAIADRRWMLVDEQGVLVSQRELPELARVTVTLADGAVRLTAAGRDDLILRPGEIAGAARPLRMFGRAVVGHAAPDHASAWFAALLGRNVTLMHQTDDDVRLCDPAYAVAPGEDRVGFADAYPYLVAGQATLDQLNGLLAAPVPVDRFRANILVGASAAEAEYGWDEIAMGSARLRLVKPCARCVMTTIDQRLGVKTGKEPLAALGRHYRLGQGAIFGENAIATRTGEVAVGDAVTLLAARPPRAFERG